jgi:hypothetical protein
MLTMLLNKSHDPTYFDAAVTSGSLEHNRVKPKLSTVFHKYDGVSASASARPGRAAIRWPSATALGDALLLASPVRGGIAPRKHRMSPLAGLLKQENISYPSALALGHIMTALAGLGGAAPIRRRICESQYLATLFSCLTCFSARVQKRQGRCLRSVGTK